MKTKFNYFKAVVFLIIANIGTLQAQKDSLDLFNMSLSDLMNIEITSASKKAESNFDSPLSTTVLTQQEIINSGASTIGEALRLVPGMIVREETNGNYDVHMRGYDNVTPDAMLNNTENTFSLVMIDSRVVYSYFQGGTLWETFPIDVNDLDRIEIIRGPATALYGPNAVNGVIHIITKRGGDKASVNGHFEAGNLSLFNGQIRGFVPITRKLTAGISGNYQVRDNYSDKYYVSKKDNYYTLSEMDTLTISSKLPYPPFTTTKTKVFPNPINTSYPGGNNSLEKYGINGYISYKGDENVNVDLSLGTQNSQGQMMTMTYSAYPSTRESNSNYVNLNADIYGLSAHFSYTTGEQNLVVGNPNFHYGFNHLEGSVEYDYKYKSLSLRPGISYQSAIYSVTDYVDPSKNEGYFTEEANLNSVGGTLRGEYKAFNDKLRLVAALRLDKYNNPDTTYFSYQFISTYKISDKHLLRAVYSQANRSPFILSSYADYVLFNPIKILGNNNLDLVTQNTFEFGIRNKWAENFQTDIEGFYASMKNFVAIKSIGAPMASNMQYVNIDATASQIGLTANATTFLTKDFSIKVFGTIQTTQMNDYAPNSNYFPNDLESGKNKWTPSFYGGLGVNYSFIQKANLNLNAYYMSKQEINTLVIGVLTPQMIDPSIILNAKLSYKVYKNNAAFINIRNINGGTQFPYMAAPKVLIMGGISINI